MKSTNFPKVHKSKQVLLEIPAFSQYHRKCASEVNTSKAISVTGRGGL
jgi:hypothetical protein